MDPTTKIYLRRAVEKRKDYCRKRGDSVLDESDVNMEEHSIFSETQFIEQIKRRMADRNDDSAGRAAPGVEKGIQKVCARDLFHSSAGIVDKNGTLLLAFFAPVGCCWKTKDLFRSSCLHTIMNDFDCY